jgi:hypothetical protein
MPGRSAKSKTSRDPMRRVRPSSQQPVRRNQCGVELCTEPTANGKPYCLDHLDLVQRADALISEVNARQREIEAVLAAGPEGWRRVDVAGSVAQDILGIVEVYGPQTIRSIARAATLTQTIVTPYVNALLNHGLIQVAPVRVGDAIEKKISLAAH